MAVNLLDFRYRLTCKVSVFFVARVVQYAGGPAGGPAAGIADGICGYSCCGIGYEMTGSICPITLPPAVGYIMPGYGFITGCM